MNEGQQSPPAAPAGRAEAGGTRPRHRRRFVARLRTYLLTGILVASPFAITVYLGWLFIEFVDSKVTPLIPPRYNPETYLPFGVPGLGLLVLLVVLIFIGWLTPGLIGRQIIRFGERMVFRMPVVRSIYGATKQIFETVMSQQTSAFRQVVLFEYPRHGSWALGFITGVTEGEVQEITADDTVNVFLPTTPNPTSGYLLFIPRKDLVVLSMTVEEGIKMVVSGGIVTPPDRRTPEEKRQKLVGPARRGMPTIPSEPAQPAGEPQEARESKKVS